MRRSGVIGELRVVDSVPEAFAELVTERVSAHVALSERPFRLGCSGGASGAACFAALAAVAACRFDRLELFFVDERCVAPDSADANQKTLREALGARLGELAGFHPMDCDAGAAAYEALLRNAGPLDCCQLGLGPDGHTASLFPDSPGLRAPAGALVVENEDPSGRNVHPRLSLTFAAIAMASAVVMTVMGADKADALGGVASGEDLPATHVDSARVLWLADAPAAARATGVA
jgi:6-phosphogluconolactonase